MTIRAGFCSVVTMVMLCSSAAGVQAETFVLGNGESFQATIVQSIGNTISMTLPGRGMRQLPISDVDRVEVTLSTGETVAGELLSWSAGAYEILAGDQLLSVRDGEIVKNVAAASRKTERRPPETNGVDEAEGDDASPEDGLDAASRPDLSTPVAEKSPLPVLVASTAPASEDAGEAVIQLSLSSEATSAIVVIYSALDRTATGDADYKKEVGVLTMEPGAKTASIHIPIIDDDQAEQDEVFELFLTVDPKTAHIDSRTIVITIQDDDS